MKKIEINEKYQRFEVDLRYDDNEVSGVDFEEEWFVEFDFR